MAAHRKRRSEPPQNPFVGTTPEQTIEEDVEDDALLGRRLAAVGPAVPTGSPWGPNEIPALTSRTVDKQPLLWVVGLHGGAGVTTLVHLIGEEAHDGRRAWPIPATPPAARVLLVARTHHLGLSQAVTAAREWSSGTLPWVNLIGLVLVDDGNKPPAQLAKLMNQIAHMTPACWRLGWHEQWRSQPASLNTANRRTRKTIRDIAKRAGAARDRTAIPPRSHP